MIHRKKLHEFYDECREVSMLIRIYRHDVIILDVFIKPKIFTIWNKYRVAVPYAVIAKELQTLHVDILNINANVEK